jgi:hypothetical protein
VRHVYGNQKEGADFTYKGGFGYHPLVISLAETQECLRLVNRSGNKTSAEGAAQELAGLVALLTRRFEKVLVRGDSAFARQDIFDVCDENGLHFAMVSGTQQNFAALAEGLDERSWRPFRATDEASTHERKTRRRGRNLRRLRARRRGKRDLKLERQWLAEIDYTPSRSAKTYRLIIRKQRIEESEQGEFFELWRYRYVLTNLPRSVSMEEVVRQTYRRCDQENVIEQPRRRRGDAHADGRLPGATHTSCALVSTNLKPWLAMLACRAKSCAGSGSASARPSSTSRPASSAAHARTSCGWRARTASRPSSSARSSAFRPRELGRAADEARLCARSLPTGLVERAPAQREQLQEVGSARSKGPRCRFRALRARQPACGSSSILLAPPGPRLSAYSRP